MMFWARMKSDASRPRTEPKVATPAARARSRRTAGGRSSGGSCAKPSRTRSGWRRRAAASTRCSPSSRHLGRHFSLRPHRRPGRDREPARGPARRGAGIHLSADRRRGRDHGRAQARPAAAEGGQGLPQEGDETAGRTRLAAGSNVVSDGLSCWPAVEQAGCQHFPMATGSGKRAASWAPFKWVNTCLGNIKTALAGTYHHVSAKHAQSYLTSFAYRFNRRFQLDSIVDASPGPPSIPPRSPIGSGCEGRRDWSRKGYRLRRAVSTDRR